MKSDTHLLNKMFRGILIYAVSSSLLVFILAPWLGSALGGKTGDPQIVKMITDYLRGFAPGLVFMRFTVLLSSIMMLDNDKKLSMMAMGTTLGADIEISQENVFHVRSSWEFSGCSSNLEKI